MLIAITYKTYTHPAGHGALARARALAPALPQHHPSPNTARPRDWLPACCLAGTTAKAHQERTQGQIRTCGGDLYSPDGPGIYPRGYRRRDTVTFCYQFRRKTQILSTSIWAGSRFTYLLPDVMVLGTGSTPLFVIFPAFHATCRARPPYSPILWGILPLSLPVCAPGTVRYPPAFAIQGRSGGPPKSMYSKVAGISKSNDDFC